MAITNRKRLSTSLSYEHFDFLTEVCDKNKQKQSVIIEKKSWKIKIYMR